MFVGFCAPFFIDMRAANVYQAKIRYTHTLLARKPHRIRLNYYGCERGSAGALSFLLYAPDLTTTNARRMSKDCKLYYGIQIYYVTITVFTTVCRPGTRSVYISCKSRTIKSPCQHIGYATHSIAAFVAALWWHTSH